MIAIARRTYVDRACIVAVGLLAANAAAAQAPQAVVPDAAVQQTAKPSVSHAFAKAMTLKAGAATLAGTIFYAATGNVVDTSVLLVLGNIGATGIYMANDYLWDHFSPNTNLSANNEGFDAVGSAWRNTAKYLTFKPAMTAWSLGTTYLYTGSAATTVTVGSVGFFAFPVMFYANNMAWDWYDWYSASPSAAPPAAPAPPVRPPATGGIAAR